MVQGKTITLRPWESSDLPFFSALRNDVDLQLSLLALPRPNPEARVVEWLDRKSNASDGLFFVIATRDNNQPVGFLEIRDMHPVHRRASLGIALASEARGKGYGREALEVAEDYLWRVFGVRKIVLEVTATNLAAINLYKGAGYEQVGIHREHFFHDGRFLDVVLMEKNVVRQT
jgi:RimJ/RimL family protein N-acetyltransferase